jgi:hypothetical protein
LITKDPAALAALAEHRLSARAWSPSSLQQFAICPYKFTLHGIHGLRPREEPAPLEQMDPLTRGGLFHAVQFALLGELRKQRGLLPVNAERLPEVLRIADRWLDHIAAQYEEDLVPAIPGVWKSEIEDLRTDLRGWLQHIAVHDDDLGADPLRVCVWTFTGGRPRSGKHRRSGRPARVRRSPARIDRSGGAATSCASGVLRITDHKTGKPPESIPAYVGGGRFLQPLLYSAGRGTTARRDGRIRASVLRDAAGRVSARGDSDERNGAAFSGQAPCDIDRRDRRRISSAGAAERTRAKPAITGRCAVPTKRLRWPGTRTGAMSAWMDLIEIRGMA